MAASPEPREHLRKARQFLLVTERRHVPRDEEPELKPAVVTDAISLEDLGQFAETPDVLKRLPRESRDGRVYAELSPLPPVGFAASPFSSMPTFIHLIPELNASTNGL